MQFLVDEYGYYGPFGGAYVPEMLYPNLEELQNNYLKIFNDQEFRKEYQSLLKDYAGRPSPLYFAKRLTFKYNAKIYLKREDLNHTGSHKINNTLGQILLAKRHEDYNKLEVTKEGNCFTSYNNGEKLTQIADTLK
ncbi:unnamed protein product, partial [marine sediment metagenome]